MQCRFPPPLTEDQISAAIDGEVEPAVLQHLSQCTSCMSRLEQARRFEQALRAKLYRWDCPSVQQLGDYHLGLLGQADADAIARHLGQCARCRAEVEELRAFLAADTAPQRPPANTSPRHPPTPRARPGPGALVARVVQRAPALAMRGRASGPLIAEADGISIILDMQPAGEGQIALAGQLVAEDMERWVGALVTLRLDGVVHMAATLDDVGGFRCEPFPAGRTELRIVPRLGRMIVLPDLDLDAEG